MRVGIGYDIHRFDSVAGPLKLGGVSIPSSRGLQGHSDADVLLHAVTDALLGAIGAPDLGELFPSSNPAYRSMDSRRFMEEAHRRVRKQGWTISNLDTTVVADEPRVTPYKAKIRRAISALLSIPEADVSVKAKTTEGFPPGADGITAQAVVLLEKARVSPRASVTRQGRTR